MRNRPARQIRSRVLLPAVAGVGAFFLLAGPVWAQDEPAPASETVTTDTVPTDKADKSDKAERPQPTPRRERFRDRFMHRDHHGGPQGRGQNDRGTRGERGDPRRPEGRNGPHGRGGPEGMQGRGGPGGPHDAQDREPGAMRARMMRAAFRDVNLTDEQQTQVREIMKEAAQPMQQFMAENAMALREAREAMDAARQARDREAMNAAREKLAAMLETGPRPDREVIQAQVRELLTQQQREVFDANLAELKQRGEAMKQRRKAMREGRGPRDDGDGMGAAETPDQPEAPKPDGDQLDL